MQTELHRRLRGITKLSYSVQMPERKLKEIKQRIYIQEVRLLASQERFYNQEERIQSGAIKDLSPVAG